MSLAVQLCHCCVMVLDALVTMRIPQASVGDSGESSTYWTF